MKIMPAQLSLMPGVRPQSYLADSYDGVEHIPAESLLALDGHRAGFRLMFGKNWAGRHAAVHIFLTEEDAAKLARTLIAGHAMHGKPPVRVKSGRVRGKASGDGVRERLKDPSVGGPGEEKQHG